MDREEFVEENEGEEVHIEDSQLPGDEPEEGDDANMDDMSDEGAAPEEEEQEEEEEGERREDMSVQGFFDHTGKFTLSFSLLLGEN